MSIHRRLSTYSYSVSKEKLRMILIVVRKSRTYLVFTAAVLDPTTINIKINIVTHYPQGNTSLAQSKGPPRSHMRPDFQAVFILGSRTVAELCMRIFSAASRILRQDCADCAPMTSGKSNSEVILCKAPSLKRGEVNTKRGCEWECMQCHAHCSMRSSPLDGEPDYTP